MSFEAYAFAEHADRIKMNPMEQIVVAIGYVVEDLEALANMTSDQLTKHPIKNFDGMQLNAETAKQRLPYSNQLPEKAEFDAVVAGPEIGLISMFATLGYASVQGRDIEIMYGEPLPNHEINPEARACGTVIKGAFSAFNETILEGAQSFFDSTHERVGRPSRMLMYAILKPLALH